MADKNDQILQVINDYIKRKRGLTTMEDIHQRMFDENEDFHTWSSVEETYEHKEWDAETFSEFLVTAKQVVEGGLDRISEAYFEIKQPKDVTVGRITSELDEFPYEKASTEGGERDGFKYEVNDGVVQARYIYADVKTNITAAGEVEELVSENSIHFRVDPDEKLVIVESTYPPYVQKMKGALGKTGLVAVVCGSLTSDYSQANERVEAFRDSFERIDLDDIGMTDGGVVQSAEPEPKLVEVNAVKLHNPEHRDDQRIEKIDVEGKALANHQLIDDRLDEGYVMRGLEARVQFENSLFDIAFSGSDMMGYAKVEDVEDYAKGQRLMANIRGRYMEHFRGL